MALRFTNSTSLGIVVDANNDTWITRDGRYVADDQDAFDFGAFDNIEYLLQGDVFAGDDGIVASAGANNLSVVVGLGASVNAAGDGIQFLGNASDDSQHRVTNDGSIIGEQGEGVDVRAANSQVTNNGFISGAGFGVFLSGDNGSAFNNGSVIGNSNGIGITGQNAELYNHGDVIAGADGLEVTGDMAQIVNTGSVTAGAIGISMLGFGVITNAGNVVGDTDGVLMAMSPGEAATLYNSGSITVLNQASSSFAVDGSAGDEAVINTGLIQGNISLEGGDDLYDGRSGTVVGTVAGGDGQDTLLGSDAGETLRGGTGDDTVRGGGGDDDLTGSDGNDVISGGDGDDRLDGGAGNDVVRGRKGDDALFGDVGTDTLAGGDGDDTIDGGGWADDLLGGRGDDLIRGASGGDTISGQAGDDTLRGDGGADTFVFAVGFDRDRIEDFNNGVDEIDVTDFGFTNFADLQSNATLSAVSGGVEIDFGGGDVLVIGGVMLGQVNGADFVF